MADKYPIFGLSQEDPVHLHTADSVDEAHRWMTGYIRGGDWGGYASIALYEMSEKESEATITSVDVPIICVNQDGDLI